MKKWKNIMKIVRSLEKSGLLLKGDSETIQNEAKEQKVGLLGVLIRTLGANLLGNILAGKEINRSGYVNKKRKGLIKAGYGSKFYF